MLIDAVLFSAVLCLLLSLPAACFAETAESIDYPPALQERLQAALAAKGPGYEPRTEHLLDDGSPRFTNRLILEDSPYLLQHAHNPVDWFPWGAEAFEEARQQDRPIFLSIGYSTCHWCHVMERESFESLDIARLLNEHFICVKVDRERRPDVDEVYMTALLLTTGRGGWPMSSFLTPDGKPFFSGTYFTPAQFVQILGRINALWGERRADLLAQADRITAALNEAKAAAGKAQEVDETAVRQAVAGLLNRYDPRLGGFGDAPKFPEESSLLLLLEAARRYGDDRALAAAETSLTAMARGGIYDQVGGGFHRYSTDAHWLVPHFEKMLYNQAHLTRAYLEAYALTGKDRYARIARQTLDYVLREMTAPEGGFYSATDADSEGEEGTYFLWDLEEIRKALASEDADFAIDLYGVTQAGNFEGRNILNLPVSLSAFAERRDMPLPRLLEQVERIRQGLRLAREGRIPPLRDDKILTAWNGMMIAALAEAAEVLGEPRYLDAAGRAATFLWSHNRRGAGELWRVHLEGSSSVPANQEDYAFLAEALAVLYDVSGEEVWLERAEEVADGMLAQFWDGDSGGFFMNAESGDLPLIVRPKHSHDGAIPSGNAVALRVLAMLAARTDKALYRDRANATLAAFSSDVVARPMAYPYLLLGADDLNHGESGPRRYASEGAVMAIARLAVDGQGAGRLTVDLRMRPGWHVNAHRPLQEDLIPTDLALDANARGWHVDSVDYPEPEQVLLGFQKEPLAVYDGTVRITARLTWKAQEVSGGPRTISVRLSLQACNDQLCLLPETLILRVSTAGLPLNRAE